MNTSDVKLRWVYASVLATCPVVGLICSIVYHNISMLWVSLAAAAMAAVIFPIGFVLMYALSVVCSRCLCGIFLLITEIVRRMKR